MCCCVSAHMPVCVVLHAVQCYSFCQSCDAMIVCHSGIMLCSSAYSVIHVHWASLTHNRQCLELISLLNGRNCHELLLCASEVQAAAGSFDNKLSSVAVTGTLLCTCASDKNKHKKQAGVLAIPTPVISAGYAGTWLAEVRHCSQCCWCWSL